MFGRKGFPLLTVAAMCGAASGQETAAIGFISAGRGAPPAADADEYPFTGATLVRGNHRFPG
jgi:hypothetical protein